jgi:hypothetical protein
MVDQRAAIAILLVMVMTLLILAVPRQARGGERVACEPQPVRGDGKEWHYRTKVGGRPEQCWYIGRPMKPRSELYWEEQQKSLPPVVTPLPGEFEMRSRGRPEGWDHKE